MTIKKTVFCDQCHGEISDKTRWWRVADVGGSVYDDSKIEFGADFDVCFECYNNSGLPQK